MKNNDNNPDVKEFMKNLEFNESLNDIRNQTQNQIKILREIAVVLKAYHDSLIEKGFKENDALMLTINYQQIILSPSQN